MIKIIKVTGNSLSPFFFPGDYVLIWRSPGRFTKLSSDDYVVFNHQDHGLLIKQILFNNPAENFIEVEGIHPDSITSKKMGRIPYQNIIGKVIRRFPHNQ